MAPKSVVVEVSIADAYDDPDVSWRGSMEVRIPAADDLHIHLRNDDRTPAAIAAVRHGGSARVLAMPNTLPAILDGQMADEYRRNLTTQGADFNVLTTIKVVNDTTPQQIIEAAHIGVVAAKQYPLGVTTHSEDGVDDLQALFPVYDAMQSVDMVLSIHGEVPGAFVMDAEALFLADLRVIARQFPRLRIVLEHITTKAATQCVHDLGPQVAATITDHHLDITLNDVVGSRIQPHHFCMPVAKRPEDRSALVAAAMSGNPKFFSGTDSAPHHVKDKESACGCAGIFNSAFHMQHLATRFRSWGALDKLEDFTSRFGADFYRLPRNQSEIVLMESALTVPGRFHGLVPFCAGQTLDFTLEWV